MDLFINKCIIKKSISKCYFLFFTHLSGNCFKMSKQSAFIIFPVKSFMFSIIPISNLQLLFHVQLISGMPFHCRSCPIPRRESETICISVSKHKLQYLPDICLIPQPILRFVLLCRIQASPSLGILSEAVQSV